METRGSMANCPPAKHRASHKKAVGGDWSRSRNQKRACGRAKSYRMESIDQECQVLSEESHDSQT